MSFFQDEEPLPTLKPVPIYSTHKDTFGQSSPDYATFKKEHPECFPDGLAPSMYTAIDPLGNEEPDCIV